MPPTIPPGGTPSPAAGAGLALEGADHLVGDPAAAEVAGLGAHRFPVDRRAVDPAGVERQRTAQVLVAGGGPLVAPGDRGVPDAVDDEVPVGRLPLELAPRGARAALQDAGDDVLAGHVV